MASAKQQQAALTGLFVAFHTCVTRSAFFRQLVTKANNGHYTHQGRKGATAIWTTRLNDEHASYGIGPLISWDVTLADKTWGSWTISQEARSFRQCLNGQTHLKLPLYDDETFAKLFETLRTACQEYIVTHRIPIGKYAPSVAEFFRPD